MKRFGGAALAALLLVACGGRLRADASSTAGTAVAAAVSQTPSAADSAGGDAFDFFLKEAEVVTASRRQQKISDSPVAIEVITRQEIASSGARDIWDLLRFRVGLNVAQASSIDGNSAEVNVRGLPGEFSQSLQVLIDGRSVLSGANSGVYWQDLPVDLDDIERIEIVRGPNSPLYGANAGQGVINIITIKPADGNRAQARGEVGQYGWHLGQISMNTAIADLRLRVSMTDRSMGSFPSPQGQQSEDLNGEPLDRRINVRGDWDGWDGGELELFAGGTDQKFAIPQGGVVGLGNGQGAYSEQYGMVQVHQKIGDHALDFTVNGRQSFNSYSADSNQEGDFDADLLLHLNYLDHRSATNLGLSLSEDLLSSNFLFSGFNAGQVSQAENRERRAYAQESYSPVDWMTASLAASFEDSDMGGEWPAYQGALVFKPLDGNTLRVSAGRSPTMPSMQNRLASLVLYEGSFPTPPSYTVLPYYVEAAGGPVKPIQVSDYEATWSSAWWDRHVTADVTGYQMELNGQIEIDAALPFGPVMLPSGPALLEPVPYVNALNMVLRGLETVLTFRPLPGSSLQLNHTYEDVHSDGPNPATNGTTPWNIVNLIAQTELAWGFNVGAQLGWVGGHYSYLADRAVDLWIPDQATVNLRIGYKPDKDLELYAVASSLAQEYRTESPDGTAIPQMYTGGLSLSFGN